jgi:hypothetical protein
MREGGEAGRKEGGVKTGEVVGLIKKVRFKTGPQVLMY